MAKNETKIKFNADVKQFNDAIDSANNEMALLKKEFRLNEEQMKTTGVTAQGLEARHRNLETQLKGSRRVVEALGDKIKVASDIYGENSKEVFTLQKKLLDAKLAEEKLQRAVNDCNNEVDNSSDSAKTAGDGFTVMKGALADLASEGIQFAIGKVVEFSDYLTGLPEATREIRQDMATLETSFDSAGYSTEQATETWKDLYAVFGEDDRAVETANNISKIAKNEADLNKWVTITTGIWGTYQDSLPVEGLAEAAQETAKTGTVTGGLADALNWSSEASQMFAKYMSEDVVTAEDAFNVALSECTTEQERQSLITETLSTLYGSAADKYRDTAGAQMEAKEATAENLLVENELANAIEPVTTAFDGLKTKMLSGMLPAVEKVSGAMTNALEWANEHPVAMKSIATAVGILAIGLGGLAIAVGICTAAQWAMNSAILANPVTWIVMAIVAVIAVLVGAFVGLWNKCEEFRNFFIGLWEKIKATWDVVQPYFTQLVENIKIAFQNLWEKIKATWDVVQPYFAVLWEGIKTAFSIFIDFVVARFQIAWEYIKLVWSVAVDWFNVIWTAIKGYVAVLKEYIVGAFKTAWSAIELIWSVVTGFFANIWNTIKGIFSAVKSVLSGDFRGAWDAIKGILGGWSGYFSNIWDKIKNVFSNVKSWFSNTFSAAWTAVKNVFSSVGSFFSNTLNNIKTTFSKVTEIIKKPFENAIDKVKDLFGKVKLSFPDIKLPHFTVKPKGWKIDDLLEGSVPKLGIDWYAKGAIFTKPTIFNTSSGLKGVGEAGAEAILPIDRLEGYVVNAIERTQNVVNMQVLADAIENLANRPTELYIGDRQIAIATASASDNVNGLRNSFKNRGLVID